MTATDSDNGPISAPKHIDTSCCKRILSVCLQLDELVHTSQIHAAWPVMAHVRITIHDSRVL